MTKGYVLFVLLLNAFVCRLGNAATGTTDTNTCWYNMKTSIIKFRNATETSNAIQQYDKCNADYIIKFITEADQKPSEASNKDCDSLYKHLMYVDVFWMTRTFMSSVSRFDQHNQLKLKPYNKNKTVREYVADRISEYENCVSSKGSIESMHLRADSDDTINRYINETTSLHEYAYDPMLYDPNALMLHLSPCMEYYRNSTSSILYENLVSIDRDGNPMDPQYKQLFGFFKHLSKNQKNYKYSPELRAKYRILFQSLYSFIDRKLYGDDLTGDNYYSNYKKYCQQSGIKKTTTDDKLFKKLFELEQEIFFDFFNEKLIPTYPANYTPGFYSHMVSLNERSQSKLLTRLGIKPPNIINCGKLKEIYKDIQITSPYSSCKDEECLAESSREQTTWEFLRQLKLIFNDKNSYNCGIK